MAKINETERQTQNHVIQLFRNQLDYKYYGDLSGQINTNIMTDKLTTWLMSPKGGCHSKSVAIKAVDELVRTSGNLQQGLYKANMEVYSLLKYGAKIAENQGESKKTVHFIDWEHSHNNEFGIAEEVTIRENSTRRPDLVVYINGIAVALIELKKSTVSVAEGIRQNISNQNEHFNPSFFTTMQFVMAGNPSEGLRYGTVKTEEKYYLEWKNDVVNTEAQPLDDVSLDVLEKCSALPDKLDWQLFSMFQGHRLIVWAALQAAFMPQKPVYSEFIVW